MGGFTLLDIEGAINGEIKPRVPNVAVEIPRGCWLTLKRDEMFARFFESKTLFYLKLPDIITSFQNIFDFIKLKFKIYCFRILI